MKFYPVIMCGGSGTRLWPLSRPTRPKQFIPLVGDRSPFQSTLVRLSQLTNAAPPLVVAGLGHAGWIAREADEVGVAAEVLLEPLARDSAPAVAAAAAWIARRDPDGVAVIVASDHHIPDDTAFLKAVEAAGVAAGQGWVVTLGVDPTGPATAYGYIQPGELLVGAAPVRRNDAFVEKPDALTAAAYLRAGYLWNSGNFIARARVLLEELDRYEPGVSAAARMAVETADPSGQGWRLGPEFASAPKISLDYAVMERTDRAAVLPVSFVWSDLGAWDAVWAASPKDDKGNAAGPETFLQDAQDCLVRTDGGLQVAVVGASRLAVVADAGSLLICGLDSSQGVKAVAEAAARAPGARGLGPSTLSSWAERYDRWLRTAALPTWWVLGGDHVHGGFHEGLSQDGVGAAEPKSARAQAGQTLVFARAAALGLAGPWRQAAEHGWRFLEQRHRRPDGLFRALVTVEGAPLDETAHLYDQALILTAMAALHDAGVKGMPAAAEALLTAGRRADRDPRSAMRLLEAALAWIEAGGGEIWRDLAREVVDQLRVADDPGHPVQAGFQVELAGLLARWARVMGQPATVAGQVYHAGLIGWNAPGLASQTALLNASVLLGGDASLDPTGYARRALDAAEGLWRHLDDPSVAGLWRERLGADGRFEVQSASASSFYQLFGAILALRRYHKNGEPGPGALSANPPTPVAAPADLETQR